MTSNTIVAARYDERRPIMTFRNISKHFAGVHALRNMSLDLYPAEVVALVGDNGAGKSTFLKVISGVNIADEGTIEMEGQEVKIQSPLSSVHLGIQTVYQDLALCDNMSVVQNLFLGREITGRFGRLSKAAMMRIANDCISQLGVEIDSLDVKVGQLSGGQRQVVAIARSMLGEPKVVLLDEPLANLGWIQRQQVAELIKRLRSLGYCIVVVSHDLLEVFEVADRVVVFRLGEKVAEIEKDDITHTGVVAAITGTDDFFDEAQSIHP